MMPCKPGGGTGVATARATSHSVEWNTMGRAVAPGLVRQPSGAMEVAPPWSLSIGEKGEVEISQPKLSNRKLMFLRSF